MIFLCLATLSGCAGNEDWVRMRPDATSPFSGVEQPHAKPYTGQVSVIYGTYDFDVNPDPVNPLDDVDGYGIWISARKSEWYIAPEIGYLSATEDDGAIGDVNDSELFAGARIVAELPFTPFSLIAGGGFSSIKIAEHSNPSASEAGAYFHGGALLHLGDNAHVGVDYKLSTYDEITDRTMFTIMAGVNW
ncbi:MAG: hypothetical protein AAEJ04_05790 [Planctomycetota bacterium]